MSEVQGHPNSHEHNGVVETKKKKEDLPGTYSYAFKQQILKAWQPVPSFGSTLFIFLLAGSFFVALGVSMLVFTKRIWRTTVQYDNICTVGSSCTVTVNVDEDVEGPVFLYYEINNFYQNYGRFLSSVDIDQLKGTVDDVSTAQSDCTFAYTMADMNTNQSWGGDYLSPDTVANPCGLFAKAVFNDTFKLYDSNNNQITIEETGIAWSTDVNNVYKRPTGSSQIQWIDPTNEHFMVWMRAAFDPDFIKLWGRIEQNLNKGTYSVVVTNNYNVSPYDGTKSIFLSTANVFGGSNSFLSIAYIVVGGISFVFALLFIINRKICKSKFKEVMQSD